LVYLSKTWDRNRGFTQKPGSGYELIETGSTTLPPELPDLGTDRIGK
jgi:hypothetical protein